MRLTHCVSLSDTICSFGNACLTCASCTFSVQAHGNAVNRSVLPCVSVAPFLDTNNADATFVDIMRVNAGVEWHSRTIAVVPSTFGTAAIICWCMIGTTVAFAKHIKLVIVFVVSFD